MFKITSFSLIARYVMCGTILIVIGGAGVVSAAAQCFPQYTNDAVRKVYRSNKVSFDGMEDLTGDGKPDVYGTELQSNNSFRNIVILPNTGTGSFGDPVVHTTTLPINPASGVFQKVRYGAIAVGDVNGDGKKDFVIRAASSPQAFFTLLSTSGTSYIQSNPTVVSANEFVVSVADLNGDGKGDIVTNVVPRFENTGGQSILAYRTANADGTFGAAVQLTSIIENISPVVGDFNGDGKADVAFKYYGNPNGFHLKVLTNLGGGLFSDDPAQMQIGMHITGTADVNNDGKLDIWGDGVLINNGAGFFTAHPLPPPLPPTPDTYPLLDAYGATVLLDYDGDGDKDLIQAWEAYRGVGGGSGAERPVRKYQRVYINDGAFNFVRNDIQKPLLGRPIEMTGDNRDELVIFVNSTNGLPRYTGSNEAALIVRENVCSPVVQGRNRIIDLNGEGISDLSTWRPSDGRWNYVSNVVENSFNWGGGSFGDTPAPGDYDGDGKTDAAVFRNPTGDWWILRSSDGVVVWNHFGTTNDIPVPGDYNGDLKTDMAVFRPSVGDWYIDYTDSPNYTFLHFGATGDIPLPADLDGDGADNICIFRPSSSDWFYLTPTFDNFVGLHWGTTGDVPVPADFDMDGKADIAVFRPSDGNWYIFRSFDQGFDFFHFGQAGDVPMMVDSDGDGILEISTYRPPAGLGGFLWLVSSQPFATWGTLGTVSERPLRIRLANN